MRQLLTFLLSVITVLSVQAQSASVSPSRLYYKVAPGGYKTQKIRVTNNSDKTQTFQVSFLNFNSPGKDGKTKLDSVDGSTGCADWLTASPSFFELEAGATQDVEVLIQVPNTPDANSVRWAVASVKLARENKGIDKSGDVQSAMQIIQSFQFLIHIFQTPPSITYKEATINAFEMKDMPGEEAKGKMFEMEVENTGQAIIDCFATVEIFNPETGEEYFIKGERAFTLLPNGSRVLKMKIPEDVPAGNYEVFGWVEYGSDEHFAKTETKKYTIEK